MEVEAAALAGDRVVAAVDQVAEPAVVEAEPAAEATEVAEAGEDDERTGIFHG